MKQSLIRRWFTQARFSHMRTTVIFFFTLVAIFLIGLNYQNNVVYLLFCFLLACTGFVFLEARQNLRNIEIDIGKVPPIYAGDALSIPVLFRDTGARQHFNISFQVYFDGQHAEELNPIKSLDDNPTDGALNFLMPHEQATAHIRIPVAKRGIYRLRSINIKSTYPFGIIMMNKDIKVDTDIIVYPKPIGDEPIPGAPIGHEAGDDVSTMDFMGHRRYQDGDPQARVDWKIVARGRPAMVKLFSEEQGNDQHVLSGDTLLQLSLEERLSQICQWVLHCEIQQEAYSLQIAHAHIPFGLGDQHRDNCLFALASVNTSSNPDSSHVENSS